MVYKPSKFALLILVGLTLFLPLTGCKQTPEEARQSWQSNIDKMERALERTEGKTEGVVAGIDDLQATLDGFGDKILPDTIAKTQGLLDQGKAALLELETKRDKLSEGITNAKIELASIPEDASTGQINARMYGKAVSGIGGALPPPYNAIALGLGTLISSAGGLFGVFGTRKAKKQTAITEDLITGLEDAKRDSAALASAMHASSKAIRDSIKLPETRVFIEAVRTKNGKASAPAA